MKYRKLRIAWLVVWGIALAMLCILWLDSYQHCRLVDARFHRLQITTATLHGAIGLNLDLDQTSSGAGALPPIYCNYMASASKQRDYGLVAPPSFSFFQCRYVMDSSCYELDAPFWIATCVTGLIAVSAWLPWSSRYSLRTLLIATTLVAAVLGLSVWLS